jgi:hypothetical protein
MVPRSGVANPSSNLEILLDADLDTLATADFARWLASALDDTSPLSADERAARAGMANRQVRIR